MSAKYTLGAYLRRGRERASLSVEAVSAGSRIVPRLVDALESDRQDLLPAPVYVRGFIRAYWEQIGADADEALRLYGEQAAPPPPLTVQEPPPPARPFPAMRRWGRVAVGSVLVAALGASGIFLLGRRQPDAVASRGAGATMFASRPPTLATLATLAPPAVSASPVLPVPSVAVTAPAAPAPPAATTAPPEETLSPGSVRERRSSGRFHVTLGNAGGVELELDGHALPALGARGQVVRDATVAGESGP
jgi:cytoskeleton protein RodZ